MSVSFVFAHPPQDVLSLPDHFLSTYQASKQQPHYVPAENNDSDWMIYGLFA